MKFQMASYAYHHEVRWFNKSWTKSSKQFNNTHSTCSHNRIYTEFIHYSSACNMQGSTPLLNSYILDEQQPSRLSNYERKSTLQDLIRYLEFLKMYKQSDQHILIQLHHFSIHKVLSMTQSQKYRVFQCHNKINSGPSCKQLLSHNKHKKTNLSLRYSMIGLMHLIQRQKLSTSICTHHNIPSEKQHLTRRNSLLFKTRPT